MLDEPTRGLALSARQGCLRISNRSNKAATCPGEAVLPAALCSLTQPSPPIWGAGSEGDLGTGRSTRKGPHLHWEGVRVTRHRLKNPPPTHKHTYTDTDTDTDTHTHTHRYLYKHTRHTHPHTSPLSVGSIRHISDWL